MLNTSKLKEKIFPKKKNTWGISLNQKRVNFFSCHKNESLIENIFFGFEELSEDLRGENKYVEELRKLKETYEIKNEPVVTLLNSEDVITRYLELPLMKDKDLKKAVFWEIEQYLPYSKEEAVIDYQVLNLDEKAQIFTAAVPFDVAASYYNIFKKAGLNLAAIDIVTNSLKRSLLYFNKDYRANFEKEDLIIVNLEEFIVNIILYKKGSSVYLKTLPIQFRRDTLDLSLFDEIIEELNYSLDIQQNIFSLEVSKCILTGSLSETPMISEIFTESLKIPVEVGQFYFSNEGKIPSELIITAGLSLRDL